MVTQHQYHFKILLLNIIIIIIIILVVFSNWATGRHEGSRGLIFRQWAPIANAKCLL